MKSRSSDFVISIIWGLLLAGVITILLVPSTQKGFGELTRSLPYLMGLIKIGLLGTMGELMGGKIVTGRWKLTGIRLGERILVWSFLGIVFTVVFPIFSFGVEGLLENGLLPGKGSGLLTALWKSTFMNIIFAFPMMCFHRLTDTAIEEGGLFRRWNIAATFTKINWQNMFGIVGLAVFWFWIPAHTITFLLPSEFRVMSAALLAIVLGFIMGLSKKLAQKKK